MHVSHTRCRLLPGSCLRVDLGEPVLRGLLRSLLCLVQVPVCGAMRLLQPGRVLL